MCDSVLVDEETRENGMNENISKTNQQIVLTMFANAHIIGCER